MDDKMNSLFYGSVLHDIGKIVQRSTNERITHSRIGVNYLRKFTDNIDILHQVNYHHVKEINGAKLENNDLAFITYIADNIASGTDRRKIETDTKRQWDSKTNLEDIFDRFGENSTRRYIVPSMLSEDTSKIFPVKDKVEFNSSEYTKIVTRITNTLSVINFTPDYQQSVLNLIEATASFIPSSTNVQESVDVSLYDHMRLTAGIACAIYLFLEEKQEYNYKNTLYNNSQNFYRQNAFKLVSFDISGIQKFLYTITTSGAHKQLRSRSFYLDMISETIVDSLLSKLGLSRANVIYSGGGRAYLVLPNTKSADKAIKEVEKEFNQFFIDKFNIQLYVSFGSSIFTANDLMDKKDNDEDNEKIYNSIFREVSHQISERKLSRYDVSTIKQLNMGGKKVGRECIICHSVDNLVEGENKCQLCFSLENFSSDLQKEKYFVVDDEVSGLQISPNMYIHKVSEEDIKSGKVNGKIYTKNEFVTGADQSIRLMMGDYSYLHNNEFGKYSDRDWTKVDSSSSPVGIKRIAALRCDVDDLGYGFIGGFKEQNSGKYNTFSRIATFSRRMSIFFKTYINSFAKDKRLTIIYSGGDDVFVLGAWDEVVEFAVDLRQKFIAWTDGKLTLSAGIGMFDSKTPINVIARETGMLEDAAKDNDKNSIALFDTKYTFNLDYFIDNIYNSKLTYIKEFFENQPEQGKTFIYRLLDLIYNRDTKDKISFARIAYTLAKAEENMSDKQLEDFKVFKSKMLNWFEDEKEILSTELALMLYIYQIRKDR